MILSYFRTSALLAGLALTGCVDSAEPLIGDTQPMFGTDVRVHVYEQIAGAQKGPDLGIFHWDGHDYRAVNQPGFEVAAFSVTALAGNDLLIQSRSTRPQIKGLEYAIARKLAPGAYIVRALDEDDADVATRAAHCTHVGTDTCRVTTREALLALARSAAAKPEFTGSITLILAPNEH